MKLTKENIQFIDNYLKKRGVKYLDVRVELIDHLSTEFEDNSNYALLIDFLNTKEAFISEFQKKRHSKIHWSYQKQLWLEFFKGFYTAKGFGLDKRDQKTISMETGIQNGGLGLLLIFQFFDGLGGMALLAAFWGIWDVFSGMILGAYWGKKNN